MSSEQTLLVMTAVLAVVALTSAFIAVRAARRPRAEAAAPPETPVVRASTEIAIRSHTDAIPAPGEASPAQEVQIVEGRVIVPPTSRQIVDATLGRPLVRVSVISHGIAHALRPESRDRILGMMRREFRSRRRQRKRAARQAARLANPTPPRPVDRPQSQAVITSEAWLGELPAPRPVAPLNGEADS